MKLSKIVFICISIIVFTFGKVDSASAINEKSPVYMIHLFNNSCAAAQIMKMPPQALAGQPAAA